MKDKPEGTRQFILQVHTDDEHVEGPRYGVITLAPANASRLVSRIRLARQLKETILGRDFLRFEEWSGLPEFIKYTERAGRIRDGNLPVGGRDDEHYGDPVELVPEGEELTDAEIEAAQEDLRMSGHSLVVDTNGVVFTAYEKHTNVEFRTDTLTLAELEAVAGDELGKLKRAVLLNVEFEDVDTESFIDAHGYDAGVTGEQVIRSETQAHFEELRDRGLILGVKVS